MQGRERSTYFIGPAVESWDLRGALQEAAGAFGQMMRHPGVQRRNAAGQANPGVCEGICQTERL